VVTLYFMLVGRPPWTTSDLPLLFQQVGQEPPCIPENLHIPAPVRALVLRGLAKAPEQRFADPAELSAALAEVLRPKTSAKGTDPELARAVEPIAGSNVPSSMEAFRAAAAEVAVSAQRQQPDYPRRAARWTIFAKPMWSRVLGDAFEELKATAASRDAATPRRWIFWAAAAVGALVLVVGMLVAISIPAAMFPSPLALDVVNEHAPGPFAASARPFAASVPASASPLAVPAPPIVVPAAPSTTGDRVRRLAPKLRRCPEAPTGTVLLELDEGLRSIDLVDVDDGDRWHSCARDLLAGVPGKARVELKF
jgi:eukaryotic-like serine/threonine-protein kinase